MHKVFAAKLPDGSTGLSEGGDGQGLSLLALSRAPGTIPPTVNPPHGPVTSPQETLAASIAPAPAPAAKLASVSPPNAQSDSFFSELARKVGFGAADTTASAQPIPSKPKVIEAKRREPSPRPDTAKTSKPEVKQAAAHPPLKPAISEAHAAAAPPAQEALVTGSQPIVQANSFESRFSGFK
jgi:hypothetical protein